MDNLNLKDLKLSKEDSRDIIELLAKKRRFKNLSYKLSKSELKDIESTLYTIEKTKKISTKKQANV